MVLEEYLPVSLYELFPKIVLPFLLTFAIFFAVLTMIKVFSKKINLVLAIGLTFFAWYGGFFDWMTTWFARSMAIVAITIFGIVFVLGILTWGIGRTKESYDKFLSPEKRLRKLLEKREKIMDEIIKARERGDEKKERARMEELERLEIEIKLASREK